MAAGRFGEAVGRRFGLSARSASWDERFTENDVPEFGAR
jgi:hypothetical protein